SAGSWMTFCWQAEAGAPRTEASAKARQNAVRFMEVSYSFAMKFTPARQLRVLHAHDLWAMPQRRKAAIHGCLSFPELTSFAYFFFAEPPGLRAGALWTGGLADGSSPPVMVNINGFGL